MRKPAFCIGENKAADQLCGNRTANQRLCFRYTDKTIPLLPKSEISSLWLSSVAAQLSLCRTLSETRRPVFLRRAQISLLRTMEKIQASEIYSLFYKCLLRKAFVLQMNYVITHIPS